jgi:hypothetical protein
VPNRSSNVVRPGHIRGLVHRAVVTAEVKLGWCRGGWQWIKWCGLAERAVGAMVL